jgi:hypothetical protein
MLVGEDAVVAGQHGPHVGGVGHHGRHHVGVRDGPGDVLGALAARRDQLLDPGRAAVVPGDRETGLDQVGGHRRAHDPQPDEPDLHDCSLNCPARRSRGSQARLASVVPVGLYSRLTQPR